uniref:Uncharacterized protein n=1 Tax=Peronospora matthiolae TaxID=2874970 RepID=A0AAV1TF67_9STRA
MVDDRQWCDDAHDAAPRRLCSYKDMVTSIEVTIADGKKIRVGGTKSVCSKDNEGKRIRMLSVLHILDLIDDCCQLVSLQNADSTLSLSAHRVTPGWKFGKSYTLGR